MRRPSTYAYLLSRPSVEPSVAADHAEELYAVRVQTSSSSAITIGWRRKTLVQTDHEGNLPLRSDSCSLQTLAPMTAGGRIPLVCCQAENHIFSLLPMSEHACQPQLWSHPQLRSEPNPWFDRGSGVNQFRKAAHQVYQLMSSPGLRPMHIWPDESPPYDALQLR